MYGLSSSQSESSFYDSMQKCKKKLVQVQQQGILKILSQETCQNYITFFIQLNSEHCFEIV